MKQNVCINHDIFFLHFYALTPWSSLTLEGLSLSGLANSERVRNLDGTLSHASQPTQSLPPPHHLLIQLFHSPPWLPCPDHSRAMIQTTRNSPYWLAFIWHFSNQPILNLLTPLYPFFLMKTSIKAPPASVCLGLPLPSDWTQCRSMCPMCHAVPPVSREMWVQTSSFIKIILCLHVLLCMLETVP